MGSKFRKRCRNGHGTAMTGAEGHFVASESQREKQMNAIEFVAGVALGTPRAAMSRLLRTLFGKHRTVSRNPTGSLRARFDLPDRFRRPLRSGYSDRQHAERFLSSGRPLPLRDAIQVVNASSIAGYDTAQVSGVLGTNDTLIFDRTVFAIGMTINLSSTLPSLTKNVSIEGLGLDRVTINGNQHGSDLVVTSGVTVASISNLTLTGGNATSGGGISNSGTPTVTTSRHRQQRGHAQWWRDFQFGTLTVTSSTISNNLVSNGSGGGFANTGGLKVINSTVADNTAGIGGGIATSLFSNIPQTGTLFVANSTIADNSATSGGGINVNGSNVPVYLLNAIVVSNASGDLGGSSVSNNYTLDWFDNLIGTGAAGEVSNGVNGNQVNVFNPGLGTLANNGGSTRTIALLPGSPAIDAGSNTYADVYAPTTDRAAALHGSCG